MKLIDLFSKPIEITSDKKPRPNGEAAPVKPTVAVTWPIAKMALAELEKDYVLRVNPREQKLSSGELLKLVKGTDAIVCLLTNQINKAVLEAAGPQLKIVASMSVGFDHIDLAAAAERNVVVTNTPGVLDNAVAEHTASLIMALAKSIPAADSFTRSGKYEGWDPRLFVGPELAGKTLGIVGLGRIGCVVAKIAKFGLGMTIVYTDLKPNTEFGSKFHAKYYALEELLPVADFVTLHVPLLPTTKHLINTERLKKMKPTAYLINTSRGPVVDEIALTKALEDRVIAGAALDVYEHEPDITPKLLKLTNVVLTPHTASATQEARNAMAQKAVANVIAVLSGKSALDAVKPH